MERILKQSIMACPDKYKDRKIIQELERRKELLQSMPETYKEIYVDIDLFSLVLLMESENLKSIHKTDEGWTIIKYV